MKPEDRKISEAYAALLLAQAQANGKPPSPKNVSKNQILPTPSAVTGSDSGFVMGKIVGGNVISSKPTSTLKSSPKENARKIGKDFEGPLAKPECETLPLRKRWFRRFGGTGFLLSLGFHFALIVFAMFWITVRITNPPEEIPDAFVTGSGGGNDGTTHTCILKPPKKPEALPPRILSKSPVASIVFPEPDFKILEFDNSLQGLNLQNALAGISGSFGGGAGTGIGGGIGSGTGIGIGSGKNFVDSFAPKKVMGATIFAEKVAVYLDCSGSMLDFLPSVRREIYAMYPDADIFEFDGIGTYVADGEVAGGRNGKAEKRPGASRRGGMRLDGTNREKLSREGKRIYSRYKERFEEGSLGAWLDVLLEEKYDALVVFSDFLDGLRQYGKDGEILFAESAYHPTKSDKRKERDLRWFVRWQTVLKKQKKSPRLYFFTIGDDPQKFLADCVELSGGEIADVRYLRDEVVGADISAKSGKKSTRSRRKKAAETEIDDADDA